MLRKKNYFHKKKVATVVADESESPSVVPGVEEEVAIAGESPSVLAPSVVPSVEELDIVGESSCVLAPIVVPSVEEEVAIVGESSSVLAPSIFPAETSGIVADVACSIPADVDVDFLMEDIICDDIAGSSSSVVDDVMNKTASPSKIE